MELGGEGRRREEDDEGRRGIILTDIVVMIASQFGVHQMESH